GRVETPGTPLPDHAGLEYGARLGRSGRAIPRTSVQYRFLESLLRKKRRRVEEALRLLFFYEREHQRFRIFDHESRRPIVRLKTGRSGVCSRMSVQKYP